MCLTGGYGPLCLYELCVQSPRHVVAFYTLFTGNQPTVLREDFCGTAAVSRRWIDEAIRRGEEFRSFAIDLDQPRFPGQSPSFRIRDKIQFLCGDCTGAQAPASTTAADIIFVGNFSIDTFIAAPNCFPISAIPATALLAPTPGLVAASSSAISTVAVGRSSSGVARRLFGAKR